MKKIILLLTIFLMLGNWSCRTKKSVTDFKQTETENVSIVDNSIVTKKETVTENNQETKTETTADKTFFEAWMSFESDKITITDKDGKVTEITNPRINQKSAQKADINKTNQTDVKQDKAATVEENQQNDVALSNDRQIKTDLQQKSSSKGKEPVWLWLIGAVVVGGLGYFILKRFSLI